jgi:hypothetical protein
MKTVTFAALLLLAFAPCFSQDTPENRLVASEPADPARERLLQEMRMIVERRDFMSPAERLRLEDLTDELANKYGDHVVRYGDTLSTIAIRYRTTVREIQSLNPDLKDPRDLYVAQILKVRR